MPIYTLSNGTEVLIADSLDESLRDQALVTPFLQKIRAHWYYLISDLLGKARYEKCDYPAQALGMCVKRGPENKIYSVQKYIPLKAIGKYGSHAAVASPKLFNILPMLPGNRVARQFGVAGKMQFCLDWSNPYSHLLLYAYSYMVPDLTGEREPSVVTQVVHTSPEIKKYGSQAFLSTSSLYNTLNQHNLWEQARFNKRVQPTAVSVEALQTWVRAIATLEMIIKDPGAPIMVRSGNKADFLASVQLLENITLPVYFNIYSGKPLFTDYEQVQPVLSWALIS